MRTMIRTTSTNLQGRLSLVSERLATEIRHVDNRRLGWLVVCLVKVLGDCELGS